jgi:hypothetical protein
MQTDQPIIYTNKFDLYKAHYTDESVKLSFKEKEEFDRWHFIDNLIRSGKYRKKRIIKMIETEFSCSRATAYRLFHDTIQFFNSMAPKSKDYKRELYAEKLEEWAEAAAREGDYDTAGRNIERSMRVLGLDREDPDLPDFKKLQPHVYELQVSEQLITALRTILTRGAVDLSQIRIDTNTQDANFTDITNPGESGQADQP